MKLDKLDALTYTLISFLILSIALLSLYYNENLSLDRSNLKSFSSYSELRNFIVKSKGKSSYSAGFPRYTILDDVMVVPLASKVLESPERITYSTTNLQVEGVDEADIVKTDGNYIYLVSGKEVKIVKAYPPEEANLISRVKLLGKAVGIFIRDDKLIVIELINRSFQQHSIIKDSSIPKSLIRIYDVSNKSNPSLFKEFSLEGFYFNSRMLNEYIYVIVMFPAFGFKEEILIPKLWLGSYYEKIKPGRVFYADVKGMPYDTYIIIIAIDIKGENKPNYVTLLAGPTSVIYVSKDNIYLAVVTQSFSKPKVATSFVSFPYEETIIFRLKMDGNEIKQEAYGKILGRVLNQFSMDEYDGYFRIATTNYVNGSQESNIYILDMRLNLVGKLEGLAPGEMIYSARFMGKRVYLVTFKKVDPFFVIDLSNPTDPKVLGELKITGYSNYLHPISEKYVIGIGKETVEAKEGNFAWYQGIKISLFDITDVSNPVELYRYLVGGRGTESPVLRDHKALLIDLSKGLMVIPVLLAESLPNSPPWAMGNYVWQGVYVFSASSEGRINLKGNITHIDYEEAAFTDIFSKSSFFVKRALYINDLLYTISDSIIKINKIDTLEQVKEISIE